jgi:hypothetical protein
MLVQQSALMFFTNMVKQCGNWGLYLDNVPQNAIIKTEGHLPNGG